MRFMPQNQAELHIYHREIADDDRSSLSVLAQYMTHDAAVLDLGLGSGALGRYLVSKGLPPPDGLTYNPAEAELARPHYLQIEVADLEQANLIAMFSGKRYDFIVCADVLEHLRQPEQVLVSCQKLLKPGGQVLMSVPNVAYAGLLGELITGDFRYRPEGLLDQTHLRFFTRASLQRLVADAGLETTSIDVIRKDLSDSEFSVAFDALAPAVSRQLLALPDALTYQFIVSARPASVGPKAIAPAQPSASSGGGHASFCAHVYWSDGGGYDEAKKVLARGAIGALKQTLRFVLPPNDQPITALRLDPADRPGFLRWHGLRLIDPQGQTLWQWDPEDDGAATLANCPQNDMVLHPPWALSDGVLSLLHGDDPWIELPLQALSAARPQGLANCVVELDAGWPMSADYLVLSQLLAPLKAEVQTLKSKEASAQSLIDSLQKQLSELLAIQVQERNETASQHAKERELEAARHAQEQRETVLRCDREIAMVQDKLTELSHQALLTQERMRAEGEFQAKRYAAALADHLASQQQLEKLQKQFDDLASHLRWIENSTVFRATRPLVHLKMRLDRWVGNKGSGPKPAAKPKRHPVNPSPVDVIVPVYRGLEDTQRCILSVLASRNKTPWRLVVINDASPEPEVTQWLTEIQAKHPREIELLVNGENLGFVGTVNRGMALHDQHDVVLLNSDTEVANDWLDRIQQAAYSDTRVATVTPFSNNATICSYPHFCQANELPAGCDTATLDKHFAAANPGQVIDVPTGVGFCMYIRRDALRHVGLFDTENFGKGYGEENDFCCRAQAAGWRNLHALDTFVRHAGGVSFGASKSARELAAMQTLRRLHPRYEPEVHTFVARDPARLFRLKVDLQRLQHSNKPVVLAVMHDRAGGTRRHALELADHMKDQALFLLLEPRQGGQVALRWLGAQESMELLFRIPGEFDQLLHALRALGVAHVHFHHLIGHDDAILTLAEQLRVAYDFTAHDYYSFCPQISLTDHTNSYCGEQGLDQCRACLKRSPAPGGISIEQWREKYLPFLQAARHVLAPSRDAAQRLSTFAPRADVRVVPHTDLALRAELPSPCPQRLSTHQPLKIVVIGALSPIKGADVLDDVAKESAQAGAQLEFHLLGYAYRHINTSAHDRLTVHGPYEEAELPTLLDRLKPDVVWFPALWPETYSYTLSACLSAGLPVVATDLGAFSERLAGRPWSWVHPWDSTPADWLQFFNSIRERHFLTGHAPEVLAATNPKPTGEAHGPWHYETHYLQGIVKLPVWGSITDDFLAQHQPHRDAVGSGAVQSVKSELLPLVIRLRSAPVFSQVARRVPLRWQTRVKSWLYK